MGIVVGFIIALFVVQMMLLLRAGMTMTQIILETELIDHDVGWSYMYSMKKTSESAWAMVICPHYFFVEVEEKLH